MSTEPQHRIGRLMVTAGSVLLLSAAVFAQAGPPIGGLTGTIALEGTVDQEYAAANTVAVKAIDGTRHVFHFAKNLVVHGGKSTTVDALKGLRAGTTVVVHYSGTGADAAIEEIDLVGSDGLKTTEGIVTNINRGRKQITIRFDNTTTETLQLTERAARDVGHDLEGAVSGGARITVFYADEGGQKVAHFFRKAS